MVKRRTVLKGIAAASASAALPMPAITQSARSRTLVFVPELDVSIMDPVVTTALATQNHAYCVFDTLYGVNSSFQARPQMVEGHTVSDDQLTWSLKLRDGLKFHDGEPVLARDCVESMRRWWKKDSFGQILARRVDSLEAADDRTVRIKLKSPFPKLPDALGHPISSALFIMPERLAKTDVAKQIPEMIGSGPLRFLKNEFVPGSRLVYEKFKGYVPRNEAPEGTAGRKEIFFDRIEWRIIPDAATSFAALQTGEVDWVNLLTPDLVEPLLSTAGVSVHVADPLGNLGLLRFNTLQPPLDNPRLRHVILSAIDQPEFMRSVTGNYPNAWKDCYSMFACGVPGVNEAGTGLMKGPKDFERLRKAVIDAGYKGEPIVIMSPVDFVTVGPLGNVAASLLGKLGFNVTFQEMDWATLQRRRLLKTPINQGGWHIFPARGASAVTVNPALNLFVRGQGAAGYSGWYEDQKVEDLAESWLNTTSETEQMRITDEIQKITFETVPIVPLGQYFPQTAMRKDLRGFLPGPATVMWNVRRT